MSEPLQTERKSKAGWLLLLLFLTLFLIGWLYFDAISEAVTENVLLGRTTSKARRIISTLNNYAADHNGYYPRASPAFESSNEAFRELFKAGLVSNENLFEESSGPFLGDGQIGEAPSFDKALEAWENHWSMVDGLSPEHPGYIALIFENAATGKRWPPSWNGSLVGQAKAGRIWKSWKIIVGRHDGSVAAEDVEHPLKGIFTVEDSSDTPAFPQSHDGLRILDVLR